MNIFLIIGLIFIIFMAGDAFLKNRIAKQAKMRAGQRERNLEGWKKLGFF